MSADQSEGNAGPSGATEGYVGHESRRVYAGDDAAALCLGLFLHLGADPEHPGGSVEDYVEVLRRCCEVLHASGMTDATSASWALMDRLRRALDRYDVATAGGSDDDMGLAEYLDYLAERIADDVDSISTHVDDLSDEADGDERRARKAAAKRLFGDEAGPLVPLVARMAEDARALEELLKRVLERQADAR